MAPERLCWQVWASIFPFPQGSQNWRDELLFVFLIYSLGYLALSLLRKLLNLSAQAALWQPWGCCGSAFQSLLLREVNPKPLGGGGYVTWSSLSLSWDKVLEFRSFITSPKAMGIHHFSSFPPRFLLLPPSHFLCLSPLSSSALCQFLWCFSSCFSSGSSLLIPTLLNTGVLSDQMTATLSKNIGGTRDLYLFEVHSIQIVSGGWELHVKNVL